ncbi:MAG TPA: FAD-dependent oxidoreductase [Pseudonocardia sp.]|nr:FAD-dependent oxidoreductase [Pseudonocardia sp.]
MRVAVVGAGVVGLSATAALLERGAGVVCYERSGVAMDERSAGSSRIFRLAHRTPELVGTAADARAGFDRWAERAGRPMIVPCGCVISGPDVPAWAAAMDAAGAPFTVGDTGPLPVREPPAEALLDPSGGVVDVDAVRAHLTGCTGRVQVGEPVEAVDVDGTVWTPSGRARFDAVLVAAGAGTPPLAARVGIDLPAALEHHVRFTFPVDGSMPWRSWIDAPATGLGTYQHASGPGRWSVGAHLDPRVTAWEVGRDAATEAARGAVLRYTRDRLTVEPRVVETLYCTPTPGLGDGIDVRRSGRVVVVHGENLFKFAPVLGERLAEACSAR